MAENSHPATDPAIYANEIQELEKQEIPKDAAGWRKRAAQVAEILARDAPARDAANKTPRAEVALLKASGLLKVLGPTKYGGGGQSWEVGYQVIRDVAKGDSSIGMLLGYSLLWSTTATVVGTVEQRDRFSKLITENNYFIGGKWRTGHTTQEFWRLIVYNRGCKPKRQRPQGHGSRRSCRFQRLQELQHRWRRL